jgi:hypothetical protein
VKRIAIFANRHFGYTEWRKNSLFEGMSVAELSAAADKYCRENPSR